MRGTKSELVLTKNPLISAWLYTSIGTVQLEVEQNEDKGWGQKASGYENLEGNGGLIPGSVPLARTPAKPTNWEAMGWAERPAKGQRPGEKEGRA